MSNQKWKRPNAQKHGVFAATAIIPGEDRREFEALHTSLIEEWQPDGPTEEDAVLDIAKSVWRKRRVQRFLEVQVLKNSLDPDHQAYDEDVALGLFAGAVACAPETAFSEWTRCLRPERINQLVEKCPRTKFKTTAEWAAAVIDEIKSQLLKTIAPAEMQEILKVSGSLSSGYLLGDDLSEQELMLDGHLSAIIDRAVKRLVQTKAMKQMLAATQIDRSSVPSKKVDRLAQRN